MALNWHITYPDWWVLYFKTANLEGVETLNMKPMAEFSANIPTIAPVFLIELYTFINAETEAMARERFKSLFPGTPITRLRPISRVLGGFLSSYSLGERIQ